MAAQDRPAVGDAYRRNTSRQGSRRAWRCRRLAGVSRITGRFLRSNAEPPLTARAEPLGSMGLPWQPSARMWRTSRQEELGRKIESTDHPSERYQAHCAQLTSFKPGDRRLTQADLERQLPLRHGRRDAPPEDRLANDQQSPPYVRITLARFDPSMHAQRIAAVPSPRLMRRSPVSPWRGWFSSDNFVCWRQASPTA